MRMEDAWIIQIAENHPSIGRQDGGLYWRPNNAGYARDLADAGVYTEDEARAAQGQGERPRDIARRLSDVLRGTGAAGSVGALLAGNPKVSEGDQR